MWDNLKIWLIALFATSFIFVFAQEHPEANVSDSVPLLFFTDTNSTLVPQQMIKQIEKEDTFKPDPVHTIWLGAVIPGYGQIVNRKYWKLPIVYGGLLGCFYAIGWNSSRFVSYKNAYLDITDGDDQTNSFIEIIPPGYTIESYGGEAAFKGLLKTGMDQARYYRDLSVIISIAYYGLTLIDAFVDAHLYDFDISPDLSLKLRPTIINDRFTTNQLSKSFSYGLSGSIKF
ncbi:MAG: DUF5683 domain-containing protein [Paludibacter sp.]|nr:DUF5683 domain-containing protein [Paludibacter sp.]